MADGVAISAAVEGIVDEAVARTLILFAGGSPGPVYGKQGKPFLQQRICGYNTAAQHAPWIVLVDLDTDHNCAPMLCVSWLPQLASRLCFRVAVRAVEAWLLADAERIAAFLRISRSKVPADPESLDNPKASHWHGHHGEWISARTWCRGTEAVARLVPPMPRASSSLLRLRGDHRSRPKEPTACGEQSPV